MDDGAGSADGGDVMVLVVCGGDNVMVLAVQMEVITWCLK